VARAELPVIVVGFCWVFAAFGIGPPGVQIRT
jgi:hypothetical protein